MFLGEYQHTLDAKGRLSLPAKFRNQMSGSFVVAKGLEGSLYVSSAEAYEGFLSQLTGRNDFDEKHRQVRRFFTAGAHEGELDSAGRVTIPASLREYAKLERDVTVIGNGDRIEIWDSAAWAVYNGETEGRIEEVTSELADLGIL
ncbi:MAG: transcriptional regulator MraZ [Actinobacteria bacterium]|nr:transcriptional regulator MraZ [Actinomycetota bacterium]